MNQKWGEKRACIDEVVSKVVGDTLGHERRLSGRVDGGRDGMR